MTSAKAEPATAVRAAPKRSGLLTTRPSLMQVAADEMRRMILSGRLLPGERLREEQLTDLLGISRPPLREALLLLQQEGLVVRTPRRGAAVISLAAADVQEILVLRSALERVAIENGVPVVDPERLEHCRLELEGMRRCAENENRAELVEQGYAFHAAIVGLAGMSRVSAIYASLHSQLVICMAMNLYARERHYESLTEHVERHQMLLDVIEAGDPAAVLVALAEHGERSFTMFKTPDIDGADQR
jgi:DNA-binding GntR family transcriptional regulator